MTLHAFVTKNFRNLLFVLLLFTFVSRVWRIDTPKEYMFDEVYHAVTGKLIARNDPRAYEWWNPPAEPNTATEWTHPYVGKLFHAAGMKIFGENAVGWRISSVLFGVGVIALTVLITKELFHDQALALLAGFLFSLDGLQITQSRIAMNDIHLTFFILLTFYSYLRFKQFVTEKNESQWKKYLLLSGISFGLAFGSKWSGILILFVMIADQIFETFRARNFSFQRTLTVLLAWSVVPCIIYTLTYSQMFFQGKDLNHYIELTKQMWWYHSNLVATHPSQSTPKEWLFNLKPVWIYVDYSKTGEIGNIYAQSNTILVWGGVTAALALVLRAVLHRQLFSVQEKNTQLSLILKLHSYNDHVRLLLMTYVAFWLPYLFSPRIMFYYHYLPALPFLCIILTYCLRHIWISGKAGRYLSGLFVAAVIVNFLIFYPNWTGLRVPKDFQETWYHLLPSWQ